MDGTTYSVNTSYDALGRPSTATFPTGLTLQNSYTAFGQLREIRNAGTGTAYWEGLSADARGNVTASRLGNGVQEVRQFAADTGYLTSIASTSTAVGTIQDLTYSFDSIGNLRSRADARQGISETFQYDELNRVTASTLTSGANQTAINVAYNALGNITSKSDIGSYTYGPNASACGASPFAGPHAVSAVAGSKTASYCYDANGNLASGDGRVVTWSAFNMPTLLQKDLRQIAITYGPSRARFKRVDQNETGSTTTHYVAGGAHEVIQTGSTIKHRTTIAGIAVVTETVTAPTATETIYMLRDHLGSADVITDAGGQVLTRYSFDAWGKRRDVTWAAFLNVPAAIWQNGKITRGFTAHEQLDQVGLVHMNGRVYDPELGRFLSADPFVADVSNLQSLNRYSYVENNPLSFTDPSGYFLSGLFKAIGKAFGAVFRAVAHALKAVLNSSIIRSLVQIAACITAPGLGCALAGAAITMASGGTPLQALKAFAFSFVNQVVWTNVGAFLKAEGIAGNILAKGLVHGTIGGAMSVAQGGNFFQGFVSSAVSASTGLVSNAVSGGDIFLDTAIVSAAGGVAAQLTGGKFANGAVTAAFANLYNKYARGALDRNVEVGGGGGNAAIAGGGLSPVAGIGIGAWLGNQIYSIYDAIVSPGGVVLNESSEEQATPEGETSEENRGSRRPSADVRADADARARDSEGKLKCPYCGGEMTEESGSSNSREYDHRYPWSRGGGSGSNNIDSTCRTCNRSKGAKTPDEWSGGR